MGRSFTPTFRIETGPATCPGKATVVTSTHGWDAKSYGRPTKANLDKYALATIKSMHLGGCNEHISKGYGFIPVPAWIKVVRQATGEVVAEWKPAPFQVI